MNNFVKYIIVTLLIVAGAKAYSQPPASFRNSKGNFSPYKKIETARENYIDRQLDLSDDESVKFWPLYRQYSQEITSVRKLKRQNMLNNRSKDQIDKDLLYDQQLVDIKRKYTQEFSKILPQAKVNLVFRSESEFRDELIKIYRERGTPD
ncbi:hypothetical protein ABDD95_06755 [Mucilaginibacter sp. PAMB04274]|uniref:hypothetical protein n=1 Tax=Mucilaginibacter sp. PAMB04274 TaxID=3138568 RepID=UPI0031F6A86F